MDPIWADTAVTCYIDGLRHITSQGDLAVSNQPLLMEHFFYPTELNPDVLKKGVITGVLVPETIFTEEDFASMMGCRDLSISVAARRFVWRSCARIS
jgi:hypothetical protein